MSKTEFVDFKAVKAAVSIEQMLVHYGLMGKLRRSGDSLSGPCPIHQGDNKTQFRVSLSKNCWNCFGRCKTGGNILDFVSRMSSGGSKPATGGHFKTGQSEAGDS